VTERRVVRAVNVQTAVRMAFAMTLSVWAIGFVLLVALYILGLVSGGLGGVEGFIASLGFTGFRLAILPFLGAYILVAGIASAVVAVVAGILCILYNSLYPIIGGVELALEEPSAPRPRPAPERPPVARPAVSPRSTAPLPAPDLPRPTQWPQRREPETPARPPSET
jgi:hypothetical protein